MVWHAWSSLDETSLARGLWRRVELFALICQTSRWKNLTATRCLDIRCTGDRFSQGRAASVDWGSVILRPGTAGSASGQHSGAASRRLRPPCPHAQVGGPNSLYSRPLSPLLSLPPRVCILQPLLSAECAEIGSGPRFRSGPFLLPCACPRAGGHQWPRAFGYRHVHSAEVDSSSTRWNLAVSLLLSRNLVW